MSGIAGYVSDNPIDPAVLIKMTDAIRHRGPDGEGAYYEEGFALGHRRLAITDVSDAAQQPMHYVSRYVITYNGQVYNYGELKAELAEYGYSFHSESDTEVILAAYDYWGVSCLNKFNGMWAFVLYDNQEKTFFISRDRFGEKPLYYYKDAGIFIFCSEIKGIYSSGLMECKFNESYLEKYLRNGPNEYDQETAFNKIFRFPFAHYFLGTNEQLLNDLEISRYWDFQVEISQETYCPEKAEKYAQQYYDLLDDAVRIRMHSSVKIGSALSGGLDSSSVAYLFNQHLKRQGAQAKQVTFSTVYKTPGTENCDESTYINLMADQLDTINHQIEPNVKDVPRDHRDVIWANENPPTSTCISGWNTYKKVKECHFRVILDGQGADEQLGGYLSSIPSYLTHLKLHSFYREAVLFGKIPHAQKDILFAFLIVHFRILFGKKLLDKIFFKVKKRNLPRPLNIKLKQSMVQGLVNLISHSEAGSMAHSVESRMPFMDYRLVEFLASVPACYKLHNGWTKYLARLAFKDKLPPEVCWRKDKMGLPIPEGHWFNGDLKDWFYTPCHNTAPGNSLPLNIRILNASLVRRLFVGQETDATYRHDVSVPMR